MIRGPISTTRRFMDLIRFEHTLFALPYAVAGAFLAARGVPDLWVFLWIIVAMVGARTAAMTFNRLVDRRFDAENPRTKNRASATGTLTPVFLVCATLAASAVFVGAAWMLNDLAFVLSFPTIFILLFYSTTKRFFSLTHFVLGLALSLSPIGAWVAVTGVLDASALPAWFLSAAVLFWTSGFDILYSCQDLEVDRRQGLFSVPARYGIKKAFVIARSCHALVPLFLVLVGTGADLGLVYFLSVAVVSVLLVYEHTLVRTGDLTLINRAFFTVNVAISILVMLGLVADLTLPLGGGS